MVMMRYFSHINKIFGRSSIVMDPFLFHGLEKVSAIFFFNISMEGHSRDLKCPTKVRMKTTTKFQENRDIFG